MDPEATPHVIVVDVDEAYAGALAEAFASLGCRVSVAAAADPALALAAKDPPDLAVVSAELPKVTGLVVCNRLRRDAALKDVPVVVIAGSTPEHVIDEHRGMRTRADAYVPRATDPREVAAQARPMIKPRKAAPPPPPPAAPAPDAAPATAEAQRPRVGLGLGLGPLGPPMSPEELRILDDTIERRRDDMDWPAVTAALEKRYLRVADRAEKVRSLEQLLQVHEVEAMNGPEAVRTAERLLALVPDHAGAVAALRRAFTRRKDHDRLAELEAHLERVRRGSSG